MEELATNVRRRTGYRDGIEGGPTTRHTIVNNHTGKKVATCSLRERGREGERERKKERERKRERKKERERERRREKERER